MQRRHADGHKVRHLQRSDQDVTLSNGHVHCVYLGGRVRGLPNFFLKPYNASQAAQPEAARHFGDSFSFSQVEQVEAICQKYGLQERIKPSGKSTSR
jgi:hypothetical protein